ncbi:MAG: hypothetical protein EOP10_19885 [Proteobacteria bacterium]|nr:MAG: hypothetical protein EOP10_19885 [Pseudomonadota bacterium]
MVDTLTSYSRKAEILRTETLKPIVKKLQKTIQSRMLEDSEPRVVPPGLIRAAAFELSYLLIRHRQWHHAALLSELAIDFLTSEYMIAGGPATHIVESALDILHSYTPRELDWSSEDYEREFLEHLIICSLISRDEETLAIDIGFGRNVMSLLKSALDLESSPGVFNFASELTQETFAIMQAIFSEVDESPANMDLYRLKNLLQRDDATPKNRLKKEYLQTLNKILASCWPEGKTEKQLKDLVKDEHFGNDLRLLLRNGLIYEEPRALRQAALFRLSHKGYELTCMHFAFTHWHEVGNRLHLQDMPSAYQSTVLQILAKESVPQLQNLLETEGQYLSPIALRFVIDHMKQSRQEKGLLEIFSNLLHNRAHAWIRVEICQALPLSSGLSLAAELLDSLLNEDPSPMVRSAARAAVQRSRRKQSMPQTRSDGT